MCICTCVYKSRVYMNSPVYQVEMLTLPCFALPWWFRTQPAELVEHHALESVRHGFESHLSAAFSFVSGLVLCCFVFLFLFLSEHLSIHVYTWSYTFMYMYILYIVHGCMSCPMYIYSVHCTYTCSLLDLFCCAVWFVWWFEIELMLYQLSCPCSMPPTHEIMIFAWNCD